MNVIPAQELGSKRYNALKLDRYADLVGDIEPGFVMQLWGRGGSGKSTFAIDFANELAKHGKVVYVSAEESFGKTISDRIKRVNATHKNLMIANWDEQGEWTALKDFLVKHGISYVIIDSLSVVDPNSKKAEGFRKWAKEKQIGLIFITHATKTGQYKGNSMVQHGVDIEIEAYEGKLRVNKTRYGVSAEDYPIQFERSGFKASAVPQKPEEPTAKEAKPTTSKAMRKNPVNVPFSTTLKDIVKTHKIRGALKLNRLLNDRTLLTFRVNRANVEGKWGDFVRYMRKNKISVLEYFHQGAILSRFEGKDFESCLKQLVAKVNPQITIHEQTHAKLVLGAAEYRRQEKALAPKKAKAKKRAAAKPKRSPKKPLQKPVAKKVFTDSIAKPMNKPKTKATTKAITKSTKKVAKKDYSAIDSALDGIKNMLNNALK